MTQIIMYTKTTLLKVAKKPFVFFFLLLTLSATAQYPNQGGGGNRPPQGAGQSGQGRGMGGMNPQQMAQFNVGRFYGKVVDDATGKGLGYASVQLLGMRFDTVTRKPLQTIIGGQLTEENGDFSLENLPVMGEFTLKIVFMGYETVEQKVTFGFQRGQRPDMSKIDKDLGNIRIGQNSQVLKEVTVRADGSQVFLALDKKVFKVDKNNVAAGGTAEDALRAVPSLSVDLDGNLTLRNAAPQVFVDGRPTNMSLDQIPADAIDNVEVITNPSAKYDAGGGQAGIVNIVLKKERRVGYNGSLRAGIDMRGRPNFGGDINAREGKVNAFVGGNMNLRRSLGTGETDRLNLFDQPNTSVLQATKSTNDRWFANVRTGLDWFISNRNTLTVAGNYVRGQFNSIDAQTITNDTLAAVLRTGLSERTTDSKRGFQNFGGQMSFKHLFPQEGKEWTADMNYNGSRSENKGDFLTRYLTSRLPDGRQQQDGSGENDFLTIQTDFQQPFANGVKLEAGARAAFRQYQSNNANYQLRNGSFVRVPSLADNYAFDDQVYAVYGTFSKSYRRWGYQAGLRVESSVYQGELLDSKQTFTQKYPLSAFPSIFTTYKLNEEDNLQLNYSRRINRPNFFQLIPFPDFSDSLLLSRGNPNLRPEFSNSLELSYQNIFNKSHNLLISVYYKYAKDLITRYQLTEFNEFLGRSAIVSTFANANASYAYGAEFVLKNTFGKWVELTSNVNLYNSILDAQNVESTLRNEQFSWFVKENMSLRLPKQWTFQINSEYVSRTAFAASSSSSGGRGGGWGGGGGHMMGPSSTAQGYTRPVFFMDLAIRKDLWQRKGSITLSMEDIFASRRVGSFTGMPNRFEQNTWRRRDPQFVRLNFSWRFGKFDASLFKRKNTRVNTEGMEGGF